jgi:hypothetical protein
VTLADLQDVPEIYLQDPDTQSSEVQIASAMSSIDALNEREADGLIKALVLQRVDLAGLPFVLADACRKKQQESRAFSSAVREVRQSRILDHGWGGTGVRNAFYTRYGNTDERDKTTAKARIAALMQILAPAPAHLRTGLTENLATVPDIDATRALAKLAIFSMETEVRDMAIEGLKLRRERDYTDIVVAGLQYPWPTIAQHAAQVVAKVQRSDLIPQLIAVLERPDPRLASVAKVGDKTTWVLRELVRINHHRNCLLCHAPAERVPAEVRRAPRPALTAPVAIPGKPLPPPTVEYYGDTESDTVVRADITYLRQDFSLLQPVSNAAPWPETQRFDFLVRTRALTKEETLITTGSLPGASEDCRIPIIRRPWQPSANSPGATPHPRDRHGESYLACSHVLAGLPSTLPVRPDRLGGVFLTLRGMKAAIHPHVCVRLVEFHCSTASCRRAPWPKRARAAGSSGSAKSLSRNVSIGAAGGGCPCRT